jgi:hypothetical protein
VDNIMESSLDKDFQPYQMKILLKELVQPPENILGYRPEELIGRCFDLFI